MKLDIDVTDEMIRDILLREYSGIQEQVNALNAVLCNPNYEPGPETGYCHRESVEDDASYYTQLRDAMRIVVNYYCAPSEKVD